MFRAAWRSLVQHKLRLVLSSLGHRAQRRLRRRHLHLHRHPEQDLHRPVRSDDHRRRGHAEDRLRRVRALPARSQRWRRRCLIRSPGVDGVAKAAGVVFADGVAIVGSDDAPIGQQGAPQFGSNWSDDEELTPYRLVDGVGPTQPTVRWPSTRCPPTTATSRSATPSAWSHLPARSKPSWSASSGSGRAGTWLVPRSLPSTPPLPKTILLDGQAGYTEIDAVAADGVTQQQLADDVVCRHRS